MRVNRLDEGHFWLSLAVEKGFTRASITTFTSLLFNLGAFNRKEIQSVNENEGIIGLWEVQGNLRAGSCADYNDLRFIENLLETKLDIKEKKVDLY